MKISIALSLLILAIGATFGWHDYQRLGTVQATRDKLAAEAVKSCITIDPAHPEDGLRITKREREDREKDIKQAVAEFIAFGKEMESIGIQDGLLDETTQRKMTEFRDRMMSLDSAQLKILIAEVRADEELKNLTGQDLFSLSIMTLASDRRQAAFALFTASSDPFKDNGMGNYVISSSHARWTKEDPTAALDWERKNGEKFPDPVNGDTKRGMISGTAANDPKLAFQQIGELGLKDGDCAIHNIGDAASPPADRSVPLTPLREYLKPLPYDKARVDVSGSAIRSLVQNASKDGFEAGSKWFDNPDSPASRSPESRMASFPTTSKATIPANGSNGWAKICLMEKPTPASATWQATGRRTTIRPLVNG